MRAQGWKGLTSPTSAPTSETKSVTNKNKKKAGANRRNKAASLKKRPPPREEVHPCLREYVKALARPFDVVGICAPWGDQRASIAMTCRARGTMTSGSLMGFAYAVFSPTPAADETFVAATTTSSTATGATALARSGTGIATFTCVGTVAGGTSEYSGGTAAQKPILASLRVRYIGPELNRNGRLFSFVDQEDYDTLGMTGDNILTRRATQSHEVSREWVTISLTNDITPRQTFLSSAAAWENTTTGNISAPICVLWYGDTTNEASFEWEAVYHCSIRKSDLQSLHRPPPLGVPVQTAQVAQEMGRALPVSAGTAKAIDVKLDANMGSEGFLDKAGRTLLNIFHYSNKISDVGAALGILA